jgi:hypothetical protein
VIRFNLLSPTATNWLKIGAVIIGHVIAVTLAHDRAIEDNDPAVAVRGQIPMLVVMVAYTSVALLLLLA